MATSHVVASHITKLLSSFRQILEFRFRENQQERIPPWKVTKTKPFLSTCYGDPSATEVPPCCEAATNKLTFSTTSVLLLLDVPLSLSRGTIFRRQKNPRRGYRPKIAGILFVCNEPGRSIPYCAHQAVALCLVDYGYKLLPSVGLWVQAFAFWWIMCNSTHNICLVDYVSSDICLVYIQFVIQALISVLWIMFETQAVGVTQALTSCLVDL